MVDKVTCKGCSLCEEACPTKVIELTHEVNGKGYHFATMARPDACTGCANCATVCPDSCITVYRIMV